MPFESRIDVKQELFLKLNFVKTGKNLSLAAVDRSEVDGLSFSSQRTFWFFVVLKISIYF